MSKPMIMMKKMGQKLQRGATMIEYALLVALIAIAVAATVVLVGNQLTNTFDSIQNCLSSGGSNCAPTPAQT